LSATFFPLPSSSGSSDSKKIKARNLFMKDYVEFTGKTLDEAIQDACTYFAVAREKLEIEIINDVKTGIFGLVGAKKATLRARRVQLQDIGLNFQHNTKEATPKSIPKPPIKTSPEAAQKSSKSPNALPGARLEALPADGHKALAGDGHKALAGDGHKALTGALHKALPESAPKELPSAGSDAALSVTSEVKDIKDDKNQNTQDAQYARPDRPSRPDRPERPEKSDRPDRNARQNPHHKHTRNRHGSAVQAGTEVKNQGADANISSGAPSGLPEESGADFERDLPVLSLESIDQDLLRKIILETLEQLVQPIVGPTENTFEVSEGRVRIRIDCADNQGLLIGRDGQTLAALQYLLSCIASRRLNASVHVQIDAGEYREKQNEKLRDLALYLAQKVRDNSRPQSTRPMSAYQRRIVHMALQDVPDVQTHSKGEGSLKRVLIVPRRKGVDQSPAKEA
jgi:spoIIIJ-associated protein